MTVVLGVLSLFIAWMAWSTANGWTGIGRPLVALGLLIGAPLVLSRPNDSKRMATAVA